MLVITDQVAAPDLLPHSGDVSITQATGHGAVRSAWERRLLDAARTRADASRSGGRWTAAARGRRARRLGLFVRGRHDASSRRGLDTGHTRRDLRVHLRADHGRESEGSSGSKSSAGIVSCAIPSGEAGDPERAWSGATAASPESPTAIGLCRLATSRRGDGDLEARARCDPTAQRLRPHPPPCHPHRVADPPAPDRAGWASDLPTFRATAPRVVCLRLQDFVRDCGVEQTDAWKRWIPDLQTEAGALLAVHEPAREYTAILEDQLPRDLRRPDVNRAGAGRGRRAGAEGQAGRDPRRARPGARLRARPAHLPRILPRAAGGAGAGGVGRADRSNERRRRLGPQPRGRLRGARIRPLRVNADAAGLGPASREQHRRRPLLAALRRISPLGCGRRLRWVAGPRGVHAVLARIASALAGPPLPLDAFLADDAYEPLPSIVQAARALFAHGGKKAGCRCGGRRWSRRAVGGRVHAAANGESARDGGVRAAADGVRGDGGVPAGVGVSRGGVRGEGEVGPSSGAAGVARHLASALASGMGLLGPACRAQLRTRRSVRTGGCARSPTPRVVAWRAKSASAAGRGCAGLGPAPGNDIAGGPFWSSRWRRLNPLGLRLPAAMGRRVERFAKSCLQDERLMSTLGG